MVYRLPCADQASAFVFQKLVLTQVYESGTTRPSADQKPADGLAVYCVQDMEMQLNEREASLVDAFRRLPSDAATELSALAERLAELAPNHRIDWSDSWSEEDLNDFRAASLHRLATEELEDRD